MYVTILVVGVESFKLFGLQLFNSDQVYCSFSKDAEKEKGMFGTLLIQLPSKFSGGDLVVEHQGVETVFSFAAQSATEGRWGLFFRRLQPSLGKGYLWFSSGSRI